MSKYSDFSKEELIHRIEVLEAGMTFYENQQKSEIQDENLLNQRKLNFLNILMNTILSNIFVAISVKDIFAGFKYIYFNQAAEQFTGVKADDIIGKTDFELFPDSRRAHEMRTEDYSTIKNGRLEK